MSSPNRWQIEKHSFFKATCIQLLCHLDLFWSNALCENACETQKLLDTDQMKHRFSLNFSKFFLLFCIDLMNFESINRCFIYAPYGSWGAGEQGEQGGVLPLTATCMIPSCTRKRKARNCHSLLPTPHLQSESYAVQLAQSWGLRNVSYRLASGVLGCGW